MIFTPFFFCFIVFVVWLTYERRKSDLNFERNTEKFWEKESAANSTRKKSLEHLNYITIPLRELPFLDTENEKIIQYQKEIQALNEKKIVNLTGISNTDLKISYGASNIGLLSAYDENFTQLSRTIYQWGLALKEDGYFKEAIKVLEFGISCRTDVTGNYTLLARLYSDQNTPEKIKQLTATAASLDSLSKHNILRQLNSIAKGI